MKSISWFTSPDNAWKVHRIGETGLENGVAETKFKYFWCSSLWIWWWSGTVCKTCTPWYVNNKGKFSPSDAGYQFKINILSFYTAITVSTISSGRQLHPPVASSRWVIQWFIINGLWIRLSKRLIIRRLSLSTFLLVSI